MAVFELERDGAVAVLWLANPQRRNAMGLEFFDGLPEQVAALEADDAVRAIVVAGRGEDFSVGLDLKGGLGEDFGEALAGGLAGARLRLYRMVQRLQRGFTALHQTPKPVLAAVHGWCIGGGLDLISACDLRYACHGARCSLRETRMAIVADLGSLQRLPALIGQGATRELALTGRDFDAQEGLTLGLFQRVFDDRESLMSGVLQVAHTIAANPPLTVQGVKRVLNQLDEQQLTAALDYVAAWNASQLASEDLMEALAAFVQKRQPEFKGR